MYVQLFVVVFSNFILRQLMLLRQRVVSASTFEDDKESRAESDAKVKNVILFPFALEYIQITHPCLQRLKVSLTPRLQR